jgi:hypothetical protein
MPRFETKSFGLIGHSAACGNSADSRWATKERYERPGHSLGFSSPDSLQDNTFLEVQFGCVLPILSLRLAAGPVRVNPLKSTSAIAIFPNGHFGPIGPRLNFPKLSAF